MKPPLLEVLRHRRAHAHAAALRPRIHMIRQLASDVNLDEEAELRRLESGAPPPASAPTHQPPPPAKRPRTAPPQPAVNELLFSESALRGKEAGAPLGQLELRRLSSGVAEVRWRPDKSGSATEIEVGAIKELQNSKREKKMAMIRISMKGIGAPPHIFNFLVSRDALDANFEAMMRFKDTLQPLMTRDDPPARASQPPVAAATTAAATAAAFAGHLQGATAATATMAARAPRAAAMATAAMATAVAARATAVAAMARVAVARASERE